jgi:PPOX class probable F420-dependent enzyme
MSTRFATFNALYDKQYINLTTFRKNGNAVPTPVWFAQDMESGILYVETDPNSGKIKRLRYTSRITLAPCTALGKITGEVIEGNARQVKDTAEMFRARGALHRKYGLKRQIFNFMLDLFFLIRHHTNFTHTYIAIEPPE